MRTNICDICYYESGKKRVGNWRISFKKNSMGLRIALDACNEHKDWLKKFKTFEEAEKATTELYSTPKPLPRLEGDVEDGK